jgi:hypothetical protein
MLKEYQTVTARCDLSDKVKKGCTGVIVMLYNEPTLAYEVEFFDSDNCTIDLLTVRPDSIDVKELPTGD